MTCEFFQTFKGGTSQLFHNVDDEEPLPNSGQKNILIVMKHY